MEACQDHRSSRVVLLWAARRAENTRFVHVKAAAFGQTGYLVMARPERCQQRCKGELRDG